MAGRYHLQGSLHPDATESTALVSYKNCYSQSLTTMRKNLTTLVAILLLFIWPAVYASTFEQVAPRSWQAAYLLVTGFVLFISSLFLIASILYDHYEYP